MYPEILPVIVLTISRSKIYRECFTNFSWNSPKDFLRNSCKGSLQKILQRFPYDSFIKYSGDFYRIFPKNSISSLSSNSYNNISCILITELLYYLPQEFFSMNYCNEFFKNSTSRTPFCISPEVGPEIYSLSTRNYSKSSTRNFQGSSQKFLHLYL